jgi:sugar phosphate isomerase/epimerase
VTYPQLSVQLYTVREALQDDLRGTLGRIAEIGFSQVEPYDFMAFDGLGDALAAAGLSAPTTHAHFVGEDAGAIFEAAAALGIRTVIDPMIGAERWQTEEDIAGIAADLNAAATIGATHGVAVGYHNHWQEFETEIAGGTGLEFLATRLDPAVVLEVDTYWAAVAGQDPAALLARLGSRVTAIHIKDGPISRQTKDQVALGSGSVPLREIIAAAPGALRVVELDDSRADRFEAVADSYAWLLSENLA